MKFWAGLKNLRLTVGLLLAFVAGGALLSGLAAWNATQEMRRPLLQQGLMAARPSSAFGRASAYQPVEITKARRVRARGLHDF